PVADVRVVAAVGDHDAGPALLLAWLGGVVEVEVVHVLEVEADRSFVAVDFDLVASLVAGREARRFEAGDGLLGEAGEEQHGVVDVAGSHLSAAGGAARDAALGPGLDDLALLDKGFRDGPDHLGDLIARDESG